MASSANPDFWSDLSGWSGRDASAALLKVNAEMFAAAPVRDRESIETFEALALGFLPKADRATLLEIARILARCPDTPPSVLDYLRRHGAEDHAIMPGRQARAAPVPHARYLATPAGRVHLASRRPIEPATVEGILVLREEASEDALAANPTFSPAMPAFHGLVRRAVERPALARILLQRADLSPAHAACLYLAADRERRGLIRQRVMETLPSTAGSPLRLQPRDAAALSEAGHEGDIARFERLLTSAFGFPGAIEWRILQSGRHLLLALALKAAGVPEKEALRIFLSLHPALSYPLSAIRELVREMRDVPGAVAFSLVETILGARALGGGSRAV